MSFHCLALKLFTTYNKFLQRSDPVAQKVYPVNLIKRISVRFLTPEAEKNGISLNIFEDTENFLPLDRVFLGFPTKNLLNQQLENGDIDQQKSMKCLTGAQAFYQSALEHVLKKMHMSETPLGSCLMN